MDQDLGPDVDQDSNQDLDQPAFILDIIISSIPQTRTHKTSRTRRHPHVPKLYAIILNSQGHCWENANGGLRRGVPHANMSISIKCA